MDNIVSNQAAARMPQSTIPSPRRNSQRGLLFVDPPELADKTTREMIDFLYQMTTAFDDAIDPARYKVSQWL